MARYFLHLRDDELEEVPDPEGLQFDSIGSLKEAMVRNARDILAGDVLHGVLNLHLRIDAETADGQLVATLPFRDALEIRPDGI